MLRIVLSEKMNAVKQVVLIERAVLETKQALEVGIAVLGYKLVRRHVHAFHQLMAFANDGGAVAPGKNGSKEAGDFDVLLFGKQMRNGNGIVGNKGGLVIQLHLLIEQAG